MDRFVVVTGGPGTGKTTTLQLLAGRGYSIAPDSARGVIRASATPANPDGVRADLAAFATAMLAWELRSYRAAQARPAPTFFDRSVVELADFWRANVLRPIPEDMLVAPRECRYRRQVFLAPIWPEIFVNDDERTQTLEHARWVDAAVRRCYSEFGYELVELPLAEPEERAEFVLRRCGWA